MFELLTIAIFVWLMVKAIGLVYTGQVIDIERPLGIALILFYVLSSIMSQKTIKAAAQ